jgi:hypothetical protein
MDHPAAPRVAIGAGSIERAAATARPTTLFAHRFAAFKRVNAEFLSATRYPGGADDEVANDLCELAGDAFELLISTPSPNDAAVVQKLQAAGDWYEGSDFHTKVLNRIVADARALLAKEA